MSIGWIKIHRKLFNHWISQEPEALAMWVRLLSEANHSPVKKMFNGNLIEIKRGQLIFGLNAFSAKSGVSVAKLRRYLKLLETEGMINKQTTNKFSLITITCYDDYQGDDKQSASKQQSNDKQTTTPKECKNNKNEKNKDNNTSESPSAFRVPYQKILDDYHSVLPELPSVQIYTDARKKKVKSNYSNNERHREEGFYKRYFAFVRESDFLMGRTEKPFSCSFEWLMNINNMAKVIEGNYHGSN